MSVEKTLEKLLKRYPEDTDLLKLKEDVAPLLRMIGIKHF